MWVVAVVIFTYCYIIVDDDCLITIFVLDDYAHKGSK